MKNTQTPATARLSYPLAVTVTFTRGSITYIGEVLGSWEMGRLKGYTVKLADGRVMDICDTAIND